MAATRVISLLTVCVTRVLFAAKSMNFWRMNCCVQEELVMIAASIMAQLFMRVLLDSREVSLVWAAEALAWRAATLVGSSGGS